ncbi:MAG: phospholipase D-like domain-containing protein [Ktedonobacteraceae bacterium]
MSLLEPGNHGIAEVVAIARVLNDMQIRQLVAALSSGALPLSVGVLQVQYMLHLSTYEARSVAKMLNNWWKEEGSSVSLVTALLASRAAYTRALADAPSVRLVWTGPISTPASTRSTMGVLLDLIDKAQQEIVIVGYILTESVSIVFEHLAAAQRRGVQVILIGDRMEGKIPILQTCWPVGQRLPLLYTRAETPDDPKSALHAKLAIADQRYLFVTSANLSYHGLTGNIEIGVEIEGLVAADAMALLNRLIADGVCTKIHSGI